MLRYHESLTLKQARDLYFEANGFGDGGYEDEWVHLKMGPIPVVFPNTAERVRSVRLHDLHHVATDYATDWKGEAEIGAWEVASSCRDHYAAWFLNLNALAIGLFIAPRAIWRAFLRGRHSANLYEGDFREEMLDETVGRLRARLGLAAITPEASLGDVVAFVLWSTAALLTGVAGMVLLFAPVVLLVGWLVG